MGRYEDIMDMLKSNGVSGKDPFKEGYPCYDTAFKLITTIQSFGNFGEMKAYADYPSHYSYDFKLYDGVSVSKIMRLIPDLSVAVGVPVTISKGDEVLNITVPKKNRTPLYIKDFRCEEAIESPIAFPLGDNTMVDLAKLPHLLIAGSSGSGKSVTINTIITSILTRTKDDDVRFIMIDPKQVELSVYDGIKNLISPVAKTVEDAIVRLEEAVRIMESRYTFLSQHGARDVWEYIDRENIYIPPVIVVVDELADLMIRAKKEIEPRLVLLAQKGRAAGIHLVVATQEPTVDVITGLIKANMPCRIALKTSTSKESVVILGHKGAEELFGHGDMIYKPSDGSNEQRMQGVFVSTEEVRKVCDYIRNENVKPVKAEYTPVKRERKFRFQNLFKKLEERKLERLYKLG